MITKEFLEIDGRMVVRAVFILPNNIEAGNIYLVGDFNDWNRSSHTLARDRDGQWFLALDLEPNRTYQFRYLRDGNEWMNDANADAYVHNQYGSSNFIVITDPTFKPYQGDGTF